jgi:phosphate transport system permease protein
VKRKIQEFLFQAVCRVLAWSCVLILVALLSGLIIEGLPSLKLHFFTNFASRYPEKAGILAPLVGSFYALVLTALFAVPIGVLTALYLEEYAQQNRFVEFIQMNISTLAGMPSIVYGLLGLAVFVRFFGFERSLLSGSLTLALLVLPMIIVASQGAIRAIPVSLREAAYALGARKYHVIFGQVLTAAMPGIMTGVILSLSRAVGESAPLILIGALSYIAFLPQGLTDAFTVLPVQIYSWASKPQPEFHAIAASAIVVLLVMLFLMNLTAVLIRNRFQRYK